MAKAKQLPSGRWRVQPQKTLSDGSHVRTSITAETKKETERLAAIWIAEQEEKKKKKKTLEDVMNEYIDTCKAQKLSPSTIRTYTMLARKSFNDIKHISIDNLTLQDIQRQIDIRSEEMEPKTLRNGIGFIRACLNALTDTNFNYRKLKVKKIKKRKKIEMKQSWKTEIPKYIAEKYGKDDYYLYMLLIIYAGLRPSESYALLWGDLSKEPIISDEIKLGSISISKAKVLTVNNGFEEKTPKSESGNRTVTVSWSLIEEILSVKPRKADNDSIIDLKPFQYHDRWNDIKKHFNLPSEMRRYDMRHFFATSLLISGATEEELKEQMGHSTSAFTHSVYVEIIKEHKDITITDFAKRSQTDIDILKSIQPDDK